MLQKNLEKEGNIEYGEIVVTDNQQIDFSTVNSHSPQINLGEMWMKCYGYIVKK